MQVIKALKSRTNWVIIVTFVLNSIQFLAPFVSPEIMVFMNSVLTALAVYLKMNPSQLY